tara:strand:+ start:3738 stop:4052 length:315 start_codon:yes stop_codon:yes gene_type:complete
MDIKEAMKTFVQFEPQEKEVSTQLKQIRAKLRPAKKIIQNHLISKKISSLQVGSTLFQLKKSKSVSINKQTFMNSTVITDDKKQQFVKENTSEGYSISTKKIKK